MMILYEQTVSGPRSRCPARQRDVRPLHSTFWRCPLLDRTRRVYKCSGHRRFRRVAREASLAPDRNSASRCHRHLNPPELPHVQGPVWLEHVCSQVDLD